MSPYESIHLVFSSSFLLLKYTRFAIFSHQKTCYFCSAKVARSAVLFRRFACLFFAAAGFPPDCFSASMVNGATADFSIALRTQIVTLRGIGWTNQQVQEHLGVSRRSVQNWWKTAQDAGYTPEAADPLRRRLQDGWLGSAPRSGRPPKTTAENRTKVLTVLRQSRDTRTLSCNAIARRILANSSRFLSSMTIHKILKTSGLSKVKPTKKPGLTLEMMKIRKEWCLAHEDWTFDDWKRVLWSDETSVCFGQRRGGERVWRTVSETFDPTCTRPRWRNF